MFVQKKLVFHGVGMSSESNIKQYITYWIELVKMLKYVVLHTVHQDKSQMELVVFECDVVNMDSNVLWNKC